MFGRAKVKRFNEEGSCAPAPNAYDAKMNEKKSGIPIVKSQRFEESKYVTPGPGQYMIPPVLGVKPTYVSHSQSKLIRSSSFRIKKTSLADLTSTSIKNGVFNAPYSSTPRKLRRSVSSSNLSHIKSTVEGDSEYSKHGTQNHEVDASKSYAEIFVCTRCENENIDNIKEKLETAEAELEICKTELRYQRELSDDIREERDKLVVKCETLSERGDRAESLKIEVEMLNQDNSTLEEEISSLRVQRKQAETELEEMRTQRLELEAKCQEEDAKNIFLHFTQEQLNSQINSLECVVASLRQENTLVSRGLKKMVAALQEEKNKNAEITDAYMKENADSEVEFNKLELELTKAKNENLQLREQEQMLQEKCAEMDASIRRHLKEKDETHSEKQRLEHELSEANKDLEVSENDKTALKDALKAAEAEKNGMALDLGEITKSKLETEGKVAEKEKEILEIQQHLEESRSELHELEMTKVGLEGALASLREEIGQLEMNVCEKTDELEKSNNNVKSLKTRCEEQELLLEENKMLIAKMEEVNKLQQEKETNLEQTVSKLHSQVEEMKSLVEEGYKDNADLISKGEEMRKELEANAAKIAAKEEMVLELEEIVLEERRAKEEQKTAIESLKEELEEAKDTNEETLLKQEATKKEIENQQKEKVELEETLANKENEIAELAAKVEELKVNREEIEESLLDTQELVACMETKLEEAYQNHKEEADRLSRELKTSHTTLEEIKMERVKLVEINTDLSSQVTESLHAIANLQDRERILGASCQEYQVQLEILQEETEGGRIKLMQAEEEISNLQTELETTLVEVGEMEAAKIQLREEYQAIVDELDNTRESKKQVMDELRETKSVGRELYLRVQELETEADAKEAELNTWMQSTHDAGTEVQLLREKVAHLEGLRDNLEVNVSEKTDLLHSLRDELNAVRESMEMDKNKHEEISKTNLRLKGNLEAHHEELRGTRRQKEELQENLDQVKIQLQQQAQISSATLKELQSKAENLETVVAKKAERISELEAGRQEQETIRMKEMDMLIELRTVVDEQKAKIAEMEEEVEKGESAQRSMEAQQRLLCEAESKTAAAEEALAKWKSRMEEAEIIMKEMEARLEQEEEQNKLLQDIIEPFKDQLESFEIEKNALLSQSEQAQDEVKKLATQYGKLLGHQNQKQKIQHVVKIKQENVELKTEIAGLREQLAKTKKTVSKLEDKVNELTGHRRFDPRMSFQTPGGRNKENSFVRESLGAGAKERSFSISTPMGPISTPMGPPRDNKAKTLRMSTGSPLRNKN